MSDPAVHTVEARVHGRYVARVPGGAPPWPLLVGFHGYGEAASGHLEDLVRIPGARDWLIVAVQGLHRFYTRKDTIVASWMTREDRELAIADNVDYVGRVLADVRQRYPAAGPLVFEGFSQGGAMAYRAAARYEAHALIVLAADVPPDVMAGTAVRLPPVLLGRGVSDAAYPEVKFMSDLSQLRQMGVAIEARSFDGGHEWTEAFRSAAGTVLARVRSGS
jgi:predicted esterase